MSRILLCLLITAAMSVSCDGTAPESLRVLDLSGQVLDPFGEAGAKDRMRRSATVFLFVRIDCPISNRYAPEIQRLHSEFASRGVKFWLVYPDPDESPEDIRSHCREFGYTIDVLRDVEHALVRRAGARVTPEAAVFVSGQELLYCGRIDDWYVDFGKARASPTKRELRGVLGQLLEGKRGSFESAPAVGCPIAELE